jgi:formamidopyrimidine-DNA glycosylase
VRRGLERVTPGHRLEGGEVLLARAIAHPAHKHEFLAGLTGSTLSAWHRRGKYLLGQLSQSDGSPGGYLGVHLRMTGQLLWLDPKTSVQPHCRVRLWLSDHHELRYVDQRTFGRLWWVPPGINPDTIMTGLNRLGPEPFDNSFSVAYLGQRLRRSRRPIKNALLDQALVAGIGNIYADEALFLSGIRPLTRCDRIGTKRIQKLHGAIGEVLTTSIESGGTTFSDYRDIYGVNGNYGGVAWVYDREGLPCRACATPIVRLKLAGRSAHYCPRCQR